ncbi:type II toxin-antitoxin system Phd/YefM family antitoxin [Promicromonospora citrea]|uniref:Antitoxin n=1 Tax=Promicromonospora citrea TaxID=43677 RepID=A0A8H9L616_9MICO|nr:type II toxin-antitoxin system Phd/YefM family antitoxin [Promicromonospora citrea]NNH51350.1 type II toxin-antitoxin system Phd/YefM family antitoxin [Promicromonospora citrea]GGM41441.1 antitoxin [Promicromonospora citrea]
MSVVTSRELNHDVSAVKRAAARGPVVITDHGRPSHVLLTFADYERLTGSHTSLADAFVMADEIDVEPVRPDGSAREIDW